MPGLVAAGCESCFVPRFLEARGARHRGVKPLLQGSRPAEDLYLSSDAWTACDQRSVFVLS